MSPVRESAMPYQSSPLTFLNNAEYNKQMKDLKAQFPYMNIAQLHLLIKYNNAFGRLKRLISHKTNNSKTESFYILDRFSKKKKHFRLTTMYISKLLNTILNKKVEVFFLIYKKQQFLKNISLQKRILKGPLKTINNLWYNRIYKCFTKLRIFKNIVNNYEYHIQPFQNRSIKNNIIGLLREMKINNHINQKKMLKNPFALKNNLFLLVCSHLVKGKHEEFMEEFFMILKGNRRKLTDEEKKFKRFEFMLKAMVKNRYALFFREFLVNDRIGVSQIDNKSQFSDLSKLTNNRPPNFRYNQNNNHGYKSNSEFWGDNYQPLKGVMSFENKNAKKGNHSNMNLSESHIINNSFYDPSNNHLETDFSKISQSHWKKHPKLFLPSLLKHIFEKRQKPIFEYMKILLMLKLIDNNKHGNNLSLLNTLRSKFGNDEGISMKLIAIFLNKILQYKIRNVQSGVMRQLKNKEIKIHKVLFGKLKSFKLQNYSSLAKPHQINKVKMGNDQYNSIIRNSIMNTANKVPLEQVSMCKHRFYMVLITR